MFSEVNIDYEILALTRKICGILSEKLQKVALYYCYSNINAELVCQNSCILLFFCSFLDIPQILHVYASSR